MRNVRIRLLLTQIVAVMVGVVASAQIPAGYYSSLKGKKGAELKTAVYEIIKSANVLEYGSGTGHTWEGFYSTDRLEDNSVVDRYSNDVRYFTTQGKVVDGMNIEHSFPKSWWGGSKNQAYQDLYNLMPCESTINSSKSNYPMGVVTTVKKENGCTKVGTGSNGYQLWEPADKWKGDFSRGYMYMATAYQNLTWSGTQALQILEQDTWPTLQEWAYTLYLEWARADAPDELEVKRNNAVYQIQGNRNPFVDFPNLMEYVWGDSIDYAFDPETTVTTSETGEPLTPVDATIYYADFQSGTGDCTTESVTAPSSGFEVWTRNSSYGWVGTGYDSDSKQKYAVEALLVTPEIDLTDYSDIKLTFNHAVNYCTTPSETYSVEVRTDGVNTVIDGITWPSGSSWTFTDAGSISLDEWAGKKINVCFRYKSTTSVTGTWEIKWLKVTGAKNQSAVKSVTSDNVAIDLSQPYKAYSIDGRQINPSTHHGVMIIRQGEKVLKVMRR